MLKHRPVLLSLGLSVFGMVCSMGCFGQDKSANPSPKVIVESDGTVEVPAQTVPISPFLSPEAKAYVTQHLKDMQNPEILKQDAGVPRFMKPYLERDYALFAVYKKDEKINGVHVYVYTPKEGVSTANRDRVLIN